MVGAGLEDLGKGLISQTGTLYGTKVKGTRYLQLTEGYITKMFLDENDQVCGYEFRSQISEKKCDRLPPSTGMVLSLGLRWKRYI